MTTQYIYDLVDTWNNGATTFTAIKMDVTDTASAVGSRLLDLQVGSTTRFHVTKGAQSTGYVIGSDALGQIVNNNSSGISIKWSTSSTATVNGNGLELNTNGNTTLSTRGPANLRFGAPDAAAPVAQTLSVQSVLTGTSNTAGGDFTITGSQSTGSGTAGHIVLQTASAGLSGATPNGLSTIATFGPNTLTGSQTTPLLSLAQTWDTSGLATGIRLNVVNTASLNTSRWLDFQHSGTSRFSIGPGTSASGYVIKTDTVGEISNDNSTGFQFKWGTNTNIILDGSGVKISGTSGAAGYLAADATNTLALRNSTAAQAFNVYNTYTSSTSFERYSVDWITTANLVIVGPNKGSVGGTQRVQRLSYLEDGGAGSTVPLLGSTCPAASGTVKSWIKVITSDGTTAYVPCWA